LCPSLKPGEVYTYHKNVKIEDCGESDLMAWADARNEVTESNENNNYRDASFEIPCEKPELEKIWVTGPDEIKAGETLQWQAYGSYSDGSQKELTSQVSWTVDASDILQNVGNGKFKGLKGGDATLKITYEGKSASKKVTVIEKTNQPPKASFKYEKDGLTVRFTSTSSDPDGDIKNYLWSFGDGGTSNQENPTYTYSSEGTYTVLLVVWDDKGKQGSDREDITITEKRIPIKVTVKNVNNYPLPKCGGEITVKAYKELGDKFENKHVAEKTELYYGGESIRVVTLLVPKDAKFIGVWQKPKDGIKEYWGSAEISPEEEGWYDFVRHTPWLCDIDFDLRSPYAQYINMDVNKEKHIDTTVNNPENTEKKVKVRLILDRDMKLDKDMKYDFDDIGPEDGFEVSSGETDFITFRYTPREEGIWKFRAVVQTLYDDKYWVVTGQHDWFLIVGKEQIMRARSLQYVADYYIGNIGIMSQEGEEVFQDRMAQAWANYSKDIGGILKETAISYDPVAGGLIGVFLDGGGGKSVEKGVKALLDFSQAGLDAWSERFILNKAKDCNICSELDKLKKLAIEEEDCWKSGDKDINKINHVLIEEGKQLAYVQGFTYEFSNNGSIYLPDIPGDLLGIKKGRIKKEMDKICQDMWDERTYAADTYCELNGGDELEQYHDYLGRTNGRWNEGSDCAQRI
jgi:PKD repeat protein